MLRATFDDVLLDLVFNLVERHSRNRRCKIGYIPLDSIVTLQIVASHQRTIESNVPRNLSRVTVTVTDPGLDDPARL
jgi:hypothetical protein